MPAAPVNDTYKAVSPAPILTSGGDGPLANDFPLSRLNYTTPAGDASGPFSGFFSIFKIEASPFACAASACSDRCARLAPPRVTGLLLCCSHAAALANSPTTCARFTLSLSPLTH